MVVANCALYLPLAESIDQLDTLVCQVGTRIYEVRWIEFYCSLLLFLRSFVVFLYVLDLLGLLWQIGISGSHVAFFALRLP